MRSMKQKKQRRDRAGKRVKGYTDYASIEKDPYMWVFSIGGYQAYSNNTCHLFEHVVTYHPELHPYWLTKNQRYLRMAEAENLPLVKVGSKQCISIMQQAAVGFVCSSKTRSLRTKGFNAGMKVVRLWEGPYLHDFTKDARYATDLESPEGSAKRIIAQNLDKYGDVVLDSSNETYFVESYEDTLLSLAVNKRIAQLQRDFFHIPEQGIFLCGNPRSYPIYDKRSFGVKCVLYSPKYRHSEMETKASVQTLIDSVDEMGKRLCDMGALLDLHLPAPIQRDEPVLMGKVEQCTNISVLQTIDSFTDLPQYDVLVSDYNENMFDCALHDKPVVILNPGKQLYLASAPQLYDYDAVVPGCQVDNWSDALDVVGARLANPSLDADVRKRALETVFEMQVVDEDNSERIVQEVKRRLGI